MLDLQKIAKAFGFSVPPSITLRILIPNIVKLVAINVSSLGMGGIDILICDYCKTKICITIIDLTVFSLKTVNKCVKVPTNVYKCCKTSHNKC